LWRWLNSDAFCPWKHRSWIFPRDPNFASKAGLILDLYQRAWDGAFHWVPINYVIFAEEKTRIQAPPKTTGLPLANEGLSPNNR